MVAVPDIGRGGDQGDLAGDDAIVGMNSDLWDRGDRDGVAWMGAVVGMNSDLRGAIGMVLSGLALLSE
jgi:hypothetical protein